MQSAFFAILKIHDVDLAEERINQIKDRFTYPDGKINFT